MSVDKYLPVQIDQPDPGLPRGTNHLFVVGIDRYTPPIRSLNNARRDAEKFVKLLTSYYQFEEAHTTTLYDEEATLRAITSKLQAQITRLQPGDNLVVYFSGHGHYNDVLKDAYWVPADGTPDGFHSYFPYSVLSSMTKAADARGVQHILFIIDSCYSGAVMVHAEKSLLQDRLERDPSRWMIASGRNEVVSDGTAGENSPFADQLFYLLETHREKGIHTLRLIDRVTENVVANAQQTPIGEPMRDVGHRGGQFIFRSRHAGGMPLPSDPIPTPDPDRKPDPTPVPAQERGEKPPIKKTVQNLVGRARTEKAIEELEEWISLYEPDLIIQIISIKADWATLRIEKIKGILYPQDEHVRSASINGRLLTLVQPFP